MADIGELVISLKAETTRLRADLGKATRLVDGHAKRSTSAMRGIESQARLVGNALRAMGGIYVLRSLANMVRRLVEVEDAAAKTARRLGIAVDQLTALQFAATQSGVAVSTFNMALQRMVRRVAEASQGTGEAKAAIRELGLDARKLGQLPVDAQLAAIADALSGVTDETQQVRLAFKLFDSEGVALLQMLKDGSAGLDVYKAKARAMGIVVTSEAAAAAERFAEALGELSGAWDGLMRSLVNSGALTALTATLQAMANFVESMRTGRPVRPSDWPAPLRALPTQDPTMRGGARADVRLAPGAGGGGGIGHASDVPGLARGSLFQASQAAVEVANSLRILSGAADELGFAVMGVGADFRDELAPTLKLITGSAEDLGYAVLGVAHRLEKASPHMTGTTFTQMAAGNMGGTSGGLASAGAGMLSGGAAGAQSATQLVMQFVATSRVWQAFSQRLDKVVAIMQEVLAPLEPALNQFSIIMAGFAKVWVAFYRPFMDLMARAVMPVLLRITQVMQRVLGIFGITFGESDFAGLLDNGGVVTLRLDTAEAMGALRRASDAILGAGDAAGLAAARNAFLAARTAAVLASGREGAGGLPGVPGGDIPNLWTAMAQAIKDALKDLWGELTGVFDNLKSFLGGLWTALTGLPKALAGALEGLFYAVRDGLGNVLKGIWGALWDYVGYYLQSIDWLVSGTLGVLNRILGALGGGGIFAAGTNMTKGGPSMLHASEAVLPAAFNPSSASFNPDVFWRSAAAALGGGGLGGMGAGQMIVNVVAVVGEDGEVHRFKSADELQGWTANRLRPGLELLERNRQIEQGTLRR